MKDSKYTLEECTNLAKQCKMLKEFYTRFPSAHAACRKNGWLDSFTWLERAYHPEWDHDSCFDEARKYKTKKEFRTSAPGAYRVSRDRGWLNNEFTWLKDVTINLEYGRIYSVYKYEFNLAGEKFVYVGLTMRPKERDRRHHEQDSAVRTFAETNHLIIPHMVILETDLTQFDARIKEDEYRHLFESEGCHILNRGPTGANVGSVGGMHRKWTKRRCYVEALKYHTAEEFREANMGAYLAATRHRWQKDYDWFENGRIASAEKRRKHTKASCHEIASSCTTLQEFREKNVSAYNVAMRNGWLKSYAWLLAKGELPQDVVRKVVELYKNGKSLKDIAKQANVSRGAVKRAIVKAEPNLFHGKYKNHIEEDEIVADYQEEWKGLKKNFAKQHGLPSVDSLNYVLRKNGVSIEHDDPPLTFEECRAIAVECKTRHEFRDKSIVAYRRAQDMGWLDRFDWFPGHRRVWDHDTCLAEARKYLTRTALKTGNLRAYVVMRKRGWLSECTWFVNGKVKPHKWNRELCLAEARKYIKISDFVHHSLGAYKCARKYGWLADYAWFKRNRCA